MISKDSLNWEYASQVPWKELVHFPNMDPVPVNRVQKNYFKNQKDIRREFLKFMKELVRNPVIPVEVFKERLARWNSILVLGIDGRTLYSLDYDVYGIDEEVRLSEAATLREIAGVYSIESESRLDERLGVFLDALKELTQLGDGNVRGTIMCCVKFYGEFLSDFLVFHTGNNALFMNMVNGMLRLRNLKGTPHYGMDLRRDLFPRSLCEAIYKANPGIVNGYLGP